MEYLLGERAVLAQRRHPAAAVAPVSWLFLLLAASTVAAATIAIPALWLAVIAIAALLAVVAVWQWRLYVTTLYTLTPRRVYHAAGRLFLRAHATTHEKVTDLDVRQGPLGRTLGYGTLIVRTAGGDLRLGALRDPFAFREALESARQAYLAFLTRRAAPAPEAPGSPPPRRGPAQDVWEGRPVGWVLAGRITGVVVSVLFFLIPLAGGLTAWLGSLGTILALVTGAIAFAAFVTIASLAHQRIHYTVHTRGAVARRGLFTRQQVETTWDKVTDVAIHQGLIGRVAGYGTIIINTAGSAAAPVHFIGVAQPDRVKEAIEWARR